MKKSLAFLSLLAAVAVAAVFVPKAHGSDVWKATLSSTDAGSTQTVAISPGVKYALQCSNPACYKTGTASSLSADCTKDFVIDGRTAAAGTMTLQDGGVQPTAELRSPAKHLREFEAAADKYVVARALDGGDPACNLMQSTFTPPKFQ